MIPPGTFRPTSLNQNPTDLKGPATPEHRAAKRARPDTDKTTSPAPALGTPATTSTSGTTSALLPASAPTHSWFLAVKLPHDAYDSSGSAHTVEGHAQVVVPDKDYYFGLVFDTKDPKLKDGQQRFTLWDSKLMRRPDRVLSGTVSGENYKNMEHLESKVQETAATVPYNRSGVEGTSNCLKFASQILAAAGGFTMPKDFDYSVGMGEFFDNIQKPLAEAGVHAKVETSPQEAAKQWEQVKDVGEQQPQTGSLTDKPISSSL